MSSGKIRANVLRETIDLAEFKSREYNPSFVLMQYFGYLRRNPDLAQHLERSEREQLSGHGVLVYHFRRISTALQLSQVTQQQGMLALSQVVRCPR